MRRVPPVVRYGTLLLGSALVFACAHRARECTSCSSCGRNEQAAKTSTATTTCLNCVSPSSSTTVLKPSPAVATPTASKPIPARNASSTASPPAASTPQPVPVAQLAPPPPVPADTTIPKVTILSVVPRETPPVLAKPKSPVVTDTHIPKVIIVFVEDSRAPSDPFEVPTPQLVMASSRTSLATKDRDIPQPPQPPTDLPLPSTTMSHLSYSNMTAHPLFTHAPDYSWLIGELRYVPERNVWTVRFASMEEKIDTVTLIAPGPLTGLTSGQLVRVEGQMMASTTGDPCPGYRVHSVNPIHLHR